MTRSRALKHWGLGDEEFVAVGDAEVWGEVGEDRGAVGDVASWGFGVAGLEKSGCCLGEGCVEVRGQGCHFLGLDSGGMIESVGEISIDNGNRVG